jgi:acetolactate synthase I/II/III large subunit
VRTPGRWSADLTEALSSARSGCPTVLAAATDLQLALTDEVEHHPTPTALPPPTATADSGIAEAAALLAATQAPVIVAGRGARAAETVLLEMAEALGAPVVTTLGAKGLATGNPHQRGLIGGIGNAHANALLARADCVLAVGASLNPWSTQGGRLLDAAQLVQIDAAREHFGAHVLPDVALWGDAEASLRRLRRELGDHRRPVPPAAPPDPAPACDEHVDGRIDPRLAFAALEAALPADRTLVLDGGHFITFACSMLSVGAPDRFVFSCDFATIGQGLAMAIGASVAAPEPRTTLVAGDGGLLMSIAELDTAVRYRLPVNVVVINDEAYGQEVHSLAAKGLPTRHAQFAVPDLGALARAWGADGHRIDTPTGLERLGELLRVPGGPRVIDIRVNPTVVSDAAREIFRQVREAVAA